MRYTTESIARRARWVRVPPAARRALKRAASRCRRQLWKLRGEDAPLKPFQG